MQELQSGASNQNQMNEASSRMTKHGPLFIQLAWNSDVVEQTRAFILPYAITLIFASDSQGFDTVEVWLVNCDTKAQLP